MDEQSQMAERLKQWKITMEESPLPPHFLEAVHDPVVILMEDSGPEPVAYDRALFWCPEAVEARRLGYGTRSIGGVWNSSEHVVDPAVLGFIVHGGARDNGRLKGLMRKWIQDAVPHAMIWKDEGQAEALLMLPDGTREELGPLAISTVARVYGRLHGRPGDTFAFDRQWNRRNWISCLAHSRGWL